MQPTQAILFGPPRRPDSLLPWRLTCSVRPAVSTVCSSLIASGVASAGFAAAPVAMVTAPFPRSGLPRGLSRRDGGYIGDLDGRKLVTMVTPTYLLNFSRTTVFIVLSFTANEDK